MKVVLGVNDLGYWFLDDEDGNSFPLVERHEDHPAAAKLLGWRPRKEFKDEEARIHAAIDWLTARMGEDFKAPKHVVEYFEQLYAELEDDADE